jgi:hypothetical protein
VRRNNTRQGSFGTYLVAGYALAMLLNVLFPHVAASVALRRYTPGVVTGIAVIQGYPDAAGHHLLNAMADAYAEAATQAGHQVRRIEVANLDFPLLRTQLDFEAGGLPPTLVQPRDDMRWAEHWLFLFPLWHGTMPALFKGFLEHIFRPGFAVNADRKMTPIGVIVPPPAC